MQAWPRRVPVAFVWIPDDFDEIDCRLQRNENLLQGLWQSLYLFASLLNIFPCALNIFKALAHCWGGNLLPNRKFKNTFSPNILQKSKESGPQGLNSKNSTFCRAYNFDHNAKLLRFGQISLLGEKEPQSRLLQATVIVACFCIFSSISALKGIQPCWLVVLRSCYATVLSGSSLGCRVVRLKVETKKCLVDANFLVSRKAWTVFFGILCPKFGGWLQPLCFLLSY